MDGVEAIARGSAAELDETLVSGSGPAGWVVGLESERESERESEPARRKVERMRRV